MRFNFFHKSFRPFFLYYLNGQKIFIVGYIEMNIQSLLILVLGFGQRISTCVGNLYTLFSNNFLVMRLKYSTTIHGHFIKQVFVLLCGFGFTYTCSGCSLKSSFVRYNILCHKFHLMYGSSHTFTKNNNLLTSIR